MEFVVTIVVVAVVVVVVVVIVVAVVVVVVIVVVVGEDKDLFLENGLKHESLQFRVRLPSEEIYSLIKKTKACFTTA